MPTSRFSQFIDAVADQKNHSLSDVLLKAKVIAHQLKSRKFRHWVNAEIDGYDRAVPLPDYRKLRASLRGDFVGSFYSAVKNVPISTSVLEKDARDALEYEWIPNSVAYIEDMLKSDGEVSRSLDIRSINYLRAKGEQIEDMILNHVFKAIPKSSLNALLTSVRSRLLELLLELRDKYPELNQNDDAAARISESDIDAVMGRKVYRNCTVIEGAEMGDFYHASQAGAVGPGAKADNMNFIQVLREAIGENSLADLAADLERLRSAMLVDSTGADQDQAVAAVAGAEAAAKKGDAEGVLDYLKAAGRWALNVAIKIGTGIAQKAIERSMGV